MLMKALPLCILLSLGTPLAAQVSIGVGLPGVSIGINLGAYPELEPIPGYPVYYAPQTDANLFFYDGLYWAYSQDGWYSSAWYNGPWEPLAVEAVPLFLLRVPVRYYRQPPMYFRAWRDDAPPRWGERWGHDWEQHHRDWDHWDRNAAPRLAPLPVYQRDYGGERYPHGERQRDLRNRHYDYQPREEVARQVYQRPAPVAVPRHAEEREEGTKVVHPPVKSRQRAARRVNDAQMPRPPKSEHRAAAATAAPPHKATRVERDKAPSVRQPQREAAQPAVTRPAAPLQPVQRQREHVRPQDTTPAPAAPKKDARDTREEKHEERDQR